MLPAGVGERQPEGRMLASGEVGALSGNTGV